MEALLKYGLKHEHKFLNFLNKELNDINLLISKTTNQFCCVDFQITNIQNNKCVMLELKSRKNDISKYPTFLIGYTKLYNIKNEYSNYPVLLVWCDECKNTYHKKYDDELLNNKVGFYNGGKCFLINKIECFYGLDELIENIKLLLY